MLRVIIYGSIVIGNMIVFLVFGMMMVDDFIVIYIWRIRGSGRLLSTPAMKLS
jgi:hypothetical protein